MLCISNAGSARIQAGELDMWLRPARGFQIGGRRGVLYCHQGAADGLEPRDIANNPGTAKLVQALAANYPVASSDLGGLATWGNTTAQTRTGQLDTWCIASTGAGASTAPRIGLGISMGFAALVNYASDHPEDFAALIGVLPVADLDHVYQTNAAGSRAAIETAWSVTYPAALPAGANPLDNASALDGISARLYYASDDPICAATQADAMVAELGANAAAINVGALGHTDAAIAAVDRPGLVEWLAGVLA